MALFQTAVLVLAASGGGGETVLLDFYADWCGPCRQMDPVVRQLHARGYPVRKVNLDHNRSLADQLGVGPVPCFVMLVDGKVADRHVGTAPLSRLEQMCRLAGAGGPQAPRSPESKRHPDTKPSAIAFPPVFAESAGKRSGGPRHDPAGSPASEWRPAGLRGGAPADAHEGIVDRLIAASVRLRVEDAGGRSCGSGTIIDSRNGKALILTCGHIFRDCGETERIRVDLLGPSRTENVPGHLMGFDLDRDVGLVMIHVPGAVDAARVAPPGHRVSRGDRVINVGCNNGGPPTARISRILGVNKFLGPPNLQASGLPVEGRSGGGLFSEDGLLIGVCNAADPTDNAGLYAASPCIHDQLDQAELSFVYRADGQRPGSSLVTTDPAPMPRQMPGSSDLVRLASLPPRRSGSPAETTPAGRAGPMSGTEQAAIEEIRKRVSQGAEVICVVRSRSDPERPSEVFVLNNASPAFVERLASEIGCGQPPECHLTSLDIPRRPLEKTAATGTRAVRGPASSPHSKTGPASSGGATSGRGAWQPRWLTPTRSR
ncbi:MAG: trypsin-like peptidase domain-containing protein [Planctomycetota bacterium]|jgi:thiol-disulfide isomerase/thioredoxin